MLMPSKLTQTTHPVLGETRLRDIAPIFSLIQVGSHHRHFSNLYTRPRYMAGLGLQLFSLWKNGQIRLPDGIRHRAEMKVLSVAGEFAGFVILRYEASQHDAVEICMCGVHNEFRGKGMGGIDAADGAR
ncbi:MAG: GNAT family N-acetyltransferase [Sterolibacterium sp.]